MFPIIPHHLTRAGVESPTPAKASLSLEASVERRDGRVTAAENIPADVYSREVDVDALTHDTTLGAAGALTVGLDRQGKLRCLNAPGGWMRELRLAGDCHSFNVLLHRAQHSRDRLVLQVVRPIRTGEELQMWFSEQTLAALAIPFLTPANIQGDKRYVCHQCSRTFETPNPLKVHLALQCDQLGMSQLYIRLSPNHSTPRHLSSSNQILNLTTLVVPAISHPLPSDTAFKFELKASRVASPSSSGPRRSVPSVDVESRSSSSPSTSHEKAVESNRTAIKPAVPRTRQSAFKPYWKRALVSSGGGNANLNKHLLNDDLKMKTQNGDERPSSNMSAFSFLTSVVDGFPPYEKHVYKMAAASTNELLAPHSSHLADSAANYFHHAAQMETLVSNLGRSKQGHLCIYCGKVYSRKYGLKIHIRTHTGFKPLQCKYCLRPFGDPSNLNKHVRLHAEGATPYKCGLCGKILVRRRDLDRHIKSRHAPGLERTIPDQPSPESPVG